MIRRQAKRLVLLSHLAAPDEVTGAERSLLNLAREFTARGREVAFMAPSDGASVEEARVLGLDVTVRPWPRLFIASHQASRWGTAQRVARFAIGSPRLLGLELLLRGSRADVALVNTLVNVGAAWAARAAGLGVVWRVAEMPGPGRRLAVLRQATQRFADRVVTVSQAVADNLAVGHARVVPSGVVAPTEVELGARRLDLRAKLGLAADAVVVGHLGQLRPHKGQAEVIEAARILADEFPEVRWLVMGDLDADPEFAGRLRQLAAPLGGRVLFPGFVRGGTAALDILLVTSLAPDPFPMTVLEGMAHGLPVVAFAGGGIPEAVVDGATGLLVPVGDVPGLAAAVRSLLKDRERARTLGRAARARALEAYSMARTASDYLAVIDEVAAG